MKNSLQADLDKLSNLAYRVGEWNAPLVRRYHALTKKMRALPAYRLLDQVYPWLFVPFTFWAIDFNGLCHVVLAAIEKGESLDKQILFMLETLPKPPPAQAQSIAGQHESAVQKGDYAAQVKTSGKYAAREEQLMEDARFVQQWTAITEMFDVSRHADRKGVIRRRFVSERSFRPDWEVKWEESDSRFRAVFDLFCQQWDLYGMQHDQPLLQRITVNLTPNGTLIFIPSWWSLDGKRDLNWKELQKLHAARVTSRQGDKLSQNLVEQRREYLKVFKLNEQAREMGLRGDKRILWVAAKMGWTGDSTRKLSRILKRASEAFLN